MKNEKLETISNLFEQKEIRSIWDAEKEEYYFSVVDVIKSLTDSNNPNDYWYRLKKRMTDVEVALTDFGEIATRELAKKHRSQGLNANRKIAKEGGEVAKTERDDFEKKLGETVLSKKNALNYKYMEQKVLEEMKDEKEDNEKKHKNLLKLFK